MYGIYRGSIGIYRDNGKENGNCHIMGLYRDSTLLWGYIRVLQGYLGIMEKRIEATI